jgi:hypothetical protein
MAGHLKKTLSPIDNAPSNCSRAINSKLDAAKNTFQQKNDEFNNTQLPKVNRILAVKIATGNKYKYS